VDPDWAYFNLWGITGSVYGRDFVDCKTPGIHLWYLLLSKLVGKNIARIKFANHFLIGSVGAIVYLLTGDIWAGLAYTVLVNSEVLLSFHGNVGQLSAAFGTLAIAWKLPQLWLLALFVEPKLIFSVLFTDGRIWFAYAAIAGLIIYILFRKKEWFGYLWESSVIIPARIGKNRTGEFYKMWFPWFTASGLTYIVPWSCFAVLARPDLLYWLPAIVYVIFIFFGKAVRQNHFLPLIPWIVLSGMSPVNIGILIAVDFISSGFHFGNTWARNYQILDEINEEAEAIGNLLRINPGTLYVNGIHSGIYIYARKPVSLGFAEQIEIREVAIERRKIMVQHWKENPPDWVVIGESPGVDFQPRGYREVERLGINRIYKKVG